MTSTVLKLRQRREIDVGVDISTDNTVISLTAIGCAVICVYGSYVKLFTYDID